MIKIDMEMPESCEKCKFKMYSYSLYCFVNDDISLNTVSKQDRHENCPLTEYKKEKTCKLTLWDEYSNTYECSECKMKWSLIEGSPNDNGMKFCPECGSKINEIL